MGFRHTMSSLIGVVVLHILTLSKTILQLNIAKLIQQIKNDTTPVGWSSGNAFVSGAGDLRFKSWACQIGHSVANGSLPLQHFFERSCVARAQ